MFIDEETKVSSFEKESSRETVELELKKIDKTRDIVKKRYPSYGVIKDFIDHLASTEKVFLLAGIKKFGGDELMNMFINSETGVMSNETGIDEDVFAHIKEEFFQTHKTVSDIKDISDRLLEKYPEAEKFVNYIEEYLIILLEASESATDSVAEIDKNKEKHIYQKMAEIAENDKAEIEEFEKIYQEFKEELERIGE